MPTIKGTLEEILRVCPNATVGGIAFVAKQTAAANEPAQRGKKTFVKTQVIVEENKLTVIVPTETKSESNLRNWRGRSKRTKSARAILYGALWPHHYDLTAYVLAFHGRGSTLKVTFTRLGGRVLDDDNLRSCCKSVRDTVAALMLADDGDPRFRWCYEQRPGGELGVKVEMEAVK